MYILVWRYHDININTFTKNQLEMLKSHIRYLKKKYNGDSDFSYNVYYGNDVTTEIEV